jgi:hypothetical protein
MEKFIEEQSVTPFSERFKTENDPRTRKLLTRLLPDAENKLAATPDRLDKTEKHIADCKARITRQYSLIDKLNLAGYDVGPAEKLLRDLIEIHDLLVRQRQVIVAILDRATP